MRNLVLVLGAGIFTIVPGYAQDTGSGEKIFVQCKACHQIGENAKNAVGPLLNGLFGRKAGTIEGYSYSPANKNSGKQIDDIVAYLKQFDSTGKKVGVVPVGSKLAKAQ